MCVRKARPEILRQTPGRALYIAASGRCYVSRKYDIFASDDWGRSWRLDCQVPNSAAWRRVGDVLPLERLLRRNVQVLRVLSDGTRVVVVHDGIYLAEPGETRDAIALHFESTGAVLKTPWP